MTKTTRRKIDTALRAKAALEAGYGGRSDPRYEVYPNQSYAWKKQPPEQAVRAL